VGRPIWGDPQPSRRGRTLIPARRVLGRRFPVSAFGAGWICTHPSPGCCPREPWAPRTSPPAERHGSGRVRPIVRRPNEEPPFHGRCPARSVDPGTRGGSSLRGPSEPRYESGALSGGFTLVELLWTSWAVSWPLRLDLGPGRLSPHEGPPPWLHRPDRGASALTNPSSPRNAAGACSPLQNWVGPQHGSQSTRRRDFALSRRFGRHRAGNWH
jgi:hypothetical protein